MASIIRIKRSTVAGNPSTLAAGELAYSALTDGGAFNGGDRLYIGIGSETNGNAANHVVIGGKYFTDMMDHVPGTLTASSALLVDADSKLDNLKVDNLDLNGNTISSTNTNGNIVLDPTGAGYVQIVGTNALVIPVGTTAQAGPSLDGSIRLNSDSGQFEGYSNGNWSSLGGVRSVDGLTYISAELNPNSSDDTLRFYTDGVLRVALDTDSLDIDSSVVVNINSTTASTSTSTGALVVDGGVGIAGELYVGGAISADSATFASINDTPIGNTIASTGAFTDLTANGDVTFTKNAESTSTTTGTLVVTGGVGVSGNINAGGNINVLGSMDVDVDLNVDGAVQIDGATTIGASGARAATTVYGTAVSITGSSNSTFGISAATGSAITQVIQAVNAVGDANLDVNVDDAFTLDATTVSIDSTDTSNFTMTANSASNKVLLIDAQNTGAGAAKVQVGTSSTDTVEVNSATQVLVTSTELQTDVTTLDVNANTVDITTTGVGNSITMTGAAVTINADSLTLRGTEGTGDVVSLSLAGQLDVDNIRLDGNTISTTDGSNTLYLDPAPVNDNAGLVVIKGDLQVDGTTTTVNSTTVTIEDPIFTLGGENPAASDDNLDRGIEYQWHDGTNAKLGFFGWSDSNSEFQFIADATNTNSVLTPAVSGVYGNVRFGKVALADSTQSTTTNTGALTVAGGVGISGQLNVAGTTNKFTATTTSSSTTTGAVVVAGGVGVAGNIYVGDDLVGAGAGTSNLDGFNIDGGTY